MKVIKTTFEEEQRQKEIEFLNLTPLQRWKHAFEVRLRMRNPDVDYSFKGKVVTVTRLGEPHQ